MSAWGTKKAIGYLIGEKLLNHIGAADSRPEWADRLPLFVAEIKRIFTADELRTYFASTTRIGVAGHLANDDDYETMRDAGMFAGDVVNGAADAILFERACPAARRRERGCSSVTHSRLGGLTQFGDNGFRPLATH